MFTLVVVAGCASTEITERQRYQGETLARPDRIIVHDFTGNPSDVPPELPFAAQMAGTITPTPEQREVGRELGAQIAEQLVADLQGMGLPAVRAAGQPAPQVNDIVLRGYLVSIDEGSASKRVLVGFGSGDAEIRAAVEGYQMTAQGLRLLGSGEVESGGSKMPGIVSPRGGPRRHRQPDRLGRRWWGEAVRRGDRLGHDRRCSRADRGRDRRATQNCRRRAGLDIVERPYEPARRAQLD